MSTVQIDRLLDTVVKLGAVTFTLTVGRQPTIRLHGGLKNLQTKVLDTDDMVSLMKSITPERNQQELQEEGGTDFGFAYGDAARFRVSVFRQRGDHRDRAAADPQQAADVRGDRAARDVRELIRRPGACSLVTGPDGIGEDDLAGDHDRLRQSASRSAHRHHGRPDRVLPRSQEIDREPARGRQRRARASPRPFAGRSVRTRT